MSQGQKLAAGFYRDVVAALLDVPHAAALVGEGSEVLGFDDNRSPDHAWGPRLHVFVEADAVEEVTRRVDDGLPDTYQSLPVRFYAWQDRRVRHHVTVATVEDWVQSELGRPVPAGSASWLGLPQQRLLQVTAGVVFHDDAGDLTRLRHQLAYYPDDVWWWMQASQWQLIANVEALPGRLAEAGDFRGASMIAALLARLLTELTFLQQRRYWPYLKWLSTAFGQLEGAERLGPWLDQLMCARTPSDREAALIASLEIVAARHNRLDSDQLLDPACKPFEVGINDARRPYLVLNAERFTHACLRKVTDSELRRLTPVGAIDQLTHSSDQLANFSRWPSSLTAVYDDLLKHSQR